MRRQSILVLAIVATVGFLVELGFGGALYNITDLGTLGGDESRALAINNSGQIVGWARTASDYLHPSYIHATLFDPTGAGNNIDLGTLGGTYSVAYCINNNGQIVGLAYPNSDYFHATLFDPTGSGNNIDLGTLAGDCSIAYSINYNGQIVGYAFVENGDRYATLFDPTGKGKNVNLGTLGGDKSEAYSINDSGQIVGFAWTTTSYSSRATLFDPTGGGNNIDLGTLGGIYSEAHSINNSGQIVGRALTTSNHFHSTLFDPTGDGNNIDLGTLGGTDSMAYSISNNGQIVGCAFLSGQQSNPATLFDPTGGGNNLDLNTLIDPGLGWTLSVAECINDNGWIVGYGLNPDGYERAFLVTPISGANTLRLFGPNGGEELVAGSTNDITWETTGIVENVFLEYSTNNGTDWTGINTVTNTGVYQWEVPQENSNECLVRIKDASYPAAVDTSDDVFTIYVCTLAYDLNHDCFVNLSDFALLVSEWLDCGNPFDSSCVP